MMEIFLGVFLLLIILSQFIRKRGNRQTKEVVVYDSRTIAGKLSSLSVRAQASLLIGGILLIAIAAFSYLSFRHYSEINELINNEQYLEAESIIIERRRSVLPLFDIDELEYNLRLKWASAAIDAEEWEQAVNQIKELKKDSIPQDLIPSAFNSYYEYINSQIPFKDKNKFDECSGWQSEKTGTTALSLYSYREYMTFFNIDSALVSEAYELFDQLQEIKTLESYKTLVRVTYNYQNINSYLTQTNDTNFVAQEYVKNPKIIHLDCKDTSVLYESQEYIEALDSKSSLEISLIKYCLNNNLISLEFLTRAAYYAFDFNYLAKRWDRPILKLAVENAYLDLLTNYRWGEKDFDLETSFLERYMEMVWWSEYNPDKGDKVAFQLKQFLSVYSKDILIVLKEETQKTREKIGATLIWENRWAISYSEFEDLNFHSFGFIRNQCLQIGEFLGRRNRMYDALYWYDLGLGMNELYPYHNSPMPSHSFYPEMSHLFESKWYYYYRANTKWNIKPYGAKLGYCEDLQKSMELGLDCLQQYVDDCN